ncbi:hypothetical protein STEG23_020373, partial [Scotinomys teguina]
TGDRSGAMNPVHPLTSSSTDMENCHSCERSARLATPERNEIAWLSSLPVPHMAIHFFLKKKKEIAPTNENKPHYFLMNLRFPKLNWTLLWGVRYDMTAVPPLCHTSH